MCFCPVFSIDQHWSLQTFLFNLIESAALCETVLTALAAWRKHGPLVPQGHFVFSTHENNFIQRVTNEHTEKNILASQLSTQCVAPSLCGYFSFVYVENTKLFFCSAFRNFVCLSFSVSQFLSSFRLSSTLTEWPLYRCESVNCISHLSTTQTSYLNNSGNSKTLNYFTVKVLHWKTPPAEAQRTALTVKYFYYDIMNLNVSSN